MTCREIFASSIAFAVAVTLPVGGHAQLKPGVVAPHAAPVVPHAVAPAPHVSVPHVSVPQTTFVQRSAAPHITAPHVIAPHIATSHVAMPHVTAAHIATAHGAPRMATPRLTTPRGGGIAARQSGRPPARDLRQSGYQSGRLSGRRGTTFAHLPQSPGRASRDRGGRGLAQRLDDRRSAGRSAFRHQPAGRALAPPGPDQPSGLHNGATGKVATRPGFHGRFVHQDERRDWGRFAGRDRDRARRRFHAGFVGWAGPVFWPYADDDIVDYTVWPYDYGEEFWSYGPEDLVEAVLWPYAADANAEAPRRGATARHGRHRTRAAPADFSATCGADGAQGIADWPISQIEKAVEPTDQQRAALADLKAASAEASRIIRAACPRQLPGTPAGRLAGMASRLEAMRNAVDIVRPALDKLYGQLSDEQKARFNALAAPQTDADKAALQRACADQASHMGQWPVDRIERAVRPTAAQRESFDALRAAVTRAAEDLAASCPGQLPATPPGRLDAVRDRIDAMRTAAAMIRDRLESFYGTLDDEQKARFNAIGSTTTRGES